MVPGSIFDWILVTILATISVVLLLGKGDMILNALNGNNPRRAKKRSEEEKKRFSRAMGVFVVVLALDELLIVFFADLQWVMFLCLVIAVVDLVVIGRFIKKNR